MPQFRMVKYHRKKYPVDIPLRFEEIAAHFDTKKISCTMPYSLHTEYSYGKRLFQNPFLEGHPELSLSSRNGVPQLWKSKQWAESFAEFLIAFTKDCTAPSVIEIHPPFDDYVDSIKDFIKIYKVFENSILAVYPHTEIHIENRCGSIYRNGQFLISTISDITYLCEQIQAENLRLRIALDIPQLYTAHQATVHTPDKIVSLLNKVNPIRSYVNGVHIWGKTLSNGMHLTHIGDLNTTFEHNNTVKQSFLYSLQQLFDDTQIRNLVLEVNSRNDDLISIINDLDCAGFQYV